MTVFRAMLGVVLGAAATGVAVPARAVPVAFDFTARVTEAVGAMPSAVGAIIAGRFAYDTSILPSEVARSVAYYNGAINALEVDGFSIASPASSQIAVANDVAGRAGVEDYLIFDIGGQTAQGVSGNISFDLIDLVPGSPAQGVTASFLSSTVLPTSFDFAETTSASVFFQTSGPTLQERATLLTLTPESVPVPEPSSCALFAWAAVLSAFVRGRLDWNSQGVKRRSRNSAVAGKTADSLG